MRILDKYILKNTAASYFFVVLTFIGLHIVIDLFSNLSDFLHAKTPLHIVLNYYAYLMPLIFLRTSIFSIPISILFSLGEMNKNNEIVTMRASGISVYRLTTPVICFSLVISLFSFFLQEKILVYSQKKAEDIKIDFIKQSYEDEKIVKNFFFRNENQLFFVSKLLPQDKAMKDVVILKESDAGYVNEKILCQDISYRQGKWKASGIITYKLDPKGRIVDNPVSMDELYIDLDEKPQAIALKKNTFAQYTSLKELRKEIKRLKKNTTSTFLRNLVIEYHKKFAEPFSHLFLAIGILPFALQIKKRKVGLSALGGGFIIGFLYYLIFSISIASGKAGILIAPLSPWVGPLFFTTMGITGIVLLR